MKSFFRSSSTGIASLILTGATLISYLLGLIRDKTLAYYFGASALTDAYNTSFLLPDFIFNFFIAGTFTGVLIPMIIEYRHRDEAEANELISVFLSVMSVVIFVVSLIAFIFTPQLMGSGFFVTDLPPAQLDLVIQLTRIMLLSPILFGLSNTLGAILMAHHHFASYSLSPALYNIGIILGTIVLAPWLGIYGATIGTVIGIILHLLVRFFDFQSVKLNFKWQFNLRHKGFQKLIITSIPRALGLVSLVWVLTLFSRVGTGLAEGTYAASVYARNFQSFAISMFGVSLATAVLPALSQLVIKGDTKALEERFEKSLKQILYIAIPAAVGMFLLAEPLIRAILGGGAFHEESIRTTAAVLLFFAFSIPFESMMHLYSRAFYAYQVVLIPALSFILFGLVASIIVHFYSHSLGVISFGIAWAIAAFFQWLLLFVIFHYSGKFVPISYRTMGKSVLKIIFATVVMAVAVSWVITVVHSTVFRVISGVSVGGIVYFGMTYFLGSDEMAVVSLILKRKFGK